MSCQPGIGQAQLAAAAVGGGGDDLDQPVALQRQDVAAERRAIHDQQTRERVDRHRTLAPQPAQYRELGGAQPDRREKLVIELRDMPRRLADRQAIALRKPGLHR